MNRRVDDPLPSLHWHYPASSLLRSSLPLARAAILSASWVRPLVPFSSHLNTRFACFALAPTSSSCRLYTGCRLGSKQVPPRLIPRTSNLRGFDSNSIPHDASADG